MNRHDALHNLYEIIDNEATPEQLKTFHEHLADCASCARLVDFEERLDRHIRQGMQNSVSVTQISTLQMRIISALDEEDALEQTVTSEITEITPMWRFGKVVAAAAAVVLLIGLGFFGMELYGHSTTYIPLEKSHWSAAGNTTSFDNSSTTNNTLASFASSYSYSLLPAYNGFQMVGGQSETVDGIPMGHFVYEDSNSSVVSVFIAPADHFTIPDDLVKHATVRGNFTFYDHNCRGCRLVYHRNGNVVVITATTNRNVDLLNFNPGSSSI